MNIHLFNVRINGKLIEELNVRSDDRLDTFLCNGRRGGKTQAMRDIILQRTVKEVTEFSVIATEINPPMGPRPRSDR